MLILLAARATAYKTPYEAWMGAYVGDSKVGYLSVNIDKADVNGVQGYRIVSSVNTRLTVLGADLTQEVSTTVLADANFVPLQEEFSMSSGGKTTTITAKFGKEAVECVISAGSGLSKKTVPIPKGVGLVGDAMFATLGVDPEIGKEYTLHYFNPLTLAVEEIKIKALRRENLNITGREYDAFVLSNITPMGEMTVWQEVGGDVVRVDAMMGISMRRETREQAMGGIAGTTEDFAVRTRVTADKPIASPRTLKSLDVILTTLDDPKMLITDSRQKMTKVKGRPGSVRVRIAANKFDGRKSARLPLKKSGLDAYLAATPYVDCDSPDVRAKAEEIIGDAKTAYAACTRMRQWIYKNCTFKTDIGITRSASDVLKSRVGVCRDYATLFAGLARASGIPAKVVSGVLYARDGFYYHAWVECWTGQWVPFDATLPMDFVDATHIKLAEGDATTMFSLAKVIGSLNAEIRGAK